MAKVKDLTGHIFTRLIVIERSFGSSKSGKTMWLCRCDCGQSIIVDGQHLRSKGTQSCGCYAKEQTSKCRHKHGLSETPEYKIWAGMKTRCYNKKARHYLNYGGRGIAICAEWLNNFDKFIADMGRRPTANHDIDRLHNDQDYSLANCAWVTKSQSARNKRTSRYWVLNGQKFDSAESAAQALNCSRTTIKVWCHGYTKNGTYTPPKVDCYSELKYK